VTAPEEGWVVTPAQSEPLPVPGHGSVEFAFTLHPPDGVVRMTPVEVTATVGDGAFTGQTTALCGGPGEPSPNLARADGVTMTVSGNYPGGYYPEAMSDGLVWPPDVHFTQKAWASVEAGGDDWLQFDWPGTITASRVIVYWQIFESKTMAAQQLLIQIPDGDGWRTVREATPHPDDAGTVITFDAIETTALRIMQPANQGPKHRPNLMWITEVQVGE